MVDQGPGPELRQRPSLYHRLSGERTARFWGTLGAIVAVVGAIAGGIAALSGGSEAGTATPPTPSAPISAVDASQARPVESGGAITTTQGLGDRINAEHCGNFGWDDLGTFRIAGVDYPDTLPVACYRNGERVWADYLVPAGTNAFTATAGIDDASTNSDSSATFTVLNAVTQEPLADSVTLHYGSSAALTAHVTGTTRLRLQVQFTLEESGLVRACWGDPRFTS